MMRLLTATASAVILALSWNAFAQDQQNQQQNAAAAQTGQSQSQMNLKESDYGKKATEDMAKMDRNQDKKLSQDEAQADPVLVGRWSEFDVNLDGSIDQTEFYLFAAHRTIEAANTGKPAGEPGSASGQTAQNPQAKPDDSQSSTGQSN